MTNNNPGQKKIEEYIRKHNYIKRWLSVMLILTILVTITTLYAMNKSATAVTEDGAEQVGMVLETNVEDSGEYFSVNEEASEEDVEIHEDDSAAEDSDSSASESGGDDESTEESNTDAENYESGEDGNLEDQTGDESKEDEELPEEADETGDPEEVPIDENNIDSNTGAGDGSETASSDAISENPAFNRDQSEDLDMKAKMNAGSENGEDGKAPMAEVPKSVDLAEYVTETVIERQLSDGTWEVISESDIAKGDHLRITLKYTMPKEAAASDDIHYEVPEQYGKVISQESELKDGTGSYEASDDNQIKIQYSDEYKNEILNSENKENSSDDVSKSDAASFALFDRFLNSFTLTAHAADDSVSNSIVYETIVDSADMGVMVVDEVAIYRNPDVSTGSDGTEKYEGGTKISSGDSIDKGDGLLFDLFYHIPIGKISAQDPTITYALIKHGVKPTSVASGFVFNDLDEKIGTFEIDTDGVVAITFYEQFADKNRTQVISGTFYFYATADCDEEKESEEVHYDFGGNFDYTILVLNKKTPDLGIKKQASKFNEDTKTIDYTVTISTTKGSKTDIVFSDYLKIYKGTDVKTETTEYDQYISASNFSGLKIVKQDKDGNQSNVSVDANSFFSTGSVILPALLEKETYICTYSFKVPEQIYSSSETIQVNNHAEASFNDSDVRKADVTTDFLGDEPNIKKTGEKTEENKVKWTIELNTEHNNLNGYVLSDIQHKLINSGWQLSDVNYSGQITVASVTAGESGYSTLKAGDVITLGNSGYKFGQDDYSSYVFTYEQTYTPGDLVYGNLKNDALIKLENSDTGNKSEANLWVGTADPLNKEAAGIEAKSDGTYKVSWKITLNAPLVRNSGNNNSEYWTFYDYINDSNEAFTAEDIDNLKRGIQSVYGGKFDIETKDNVSIGNVVKGCHKITVKFYQDITETVSFTYSSTGYVGDGRSSVVFSNKAAAYNLNIYGKEASQNYEPVILKYDGNNVRGSSKIDFYSADAYKQGILSWNIKVNVPEKTNYETLYVLDNLPEGIELLENGQYDNRFLYGVEIAGNDSFIGSVGFETDTVTFKDVTYTKKTEGRKVIISFDARQAKGQSFYIKVRAKILGSYDFKNVKEGEFKNSVILSKDSAGSTVIGTDEQTQYVTRTEEAITKTSVDAENAMNTKAYTLDINKNAADFVKDGDVLSLTDTLTATSQSPFDVALKAGSVKVEEVTVDSEGNEVVRVLPTTDYSYAASNYSTQTNYWQPYQNISTIVFKLPDEKHLRISYQYIFSGDDGITINVSNEAKLEGISIDKNSAGNSTLVKVQSSGTRARTSGINIYKVDSENSAIFLPGAEFELYKWNGTEWTKTENTSVEDRRFVTDAEGHLPVLNLEKNTAYKLVEIQAPAGYVNDGRVLYFYIPSKTGELKLPPDFSERLGGVSLTEGQMVYISNTKATTQITVKKQWVNEDAATKPSSIEVKIGRRLGREADKAGDAYYTVNIDKRNGNGIIDQFKGYPSVKKGSVLRFSFYTYSTQYYSDLTKVYVNGEELDYTADLNYGGIQQITKTVTVGQDTNILIKYPYAVNDAAQYPVSSEVVPPEIAPGTVAANDQQDDNYRTITITADSRGEWQNTITGLERYGKGDDGKQYVWNYYVSEISNVYYTATYSDNNINGINSGTITITNTRNEVQAYSLPETGGKGKLPFVVIGALMVITATIGEAVNLVKRKRKNK